MRSACLSVSTMTRMVIWGYWRLGVSPPIVSVGHFERMQKEAGDWRMELASDKGIRLARWGRNRGHLSRTHDFGLCREVVQEPKSGLPEEVGLTQLSNDLR
jgi:hypothetical protein